MAHRLFRLAFWGLIAALACAGFGYWSATRMPVFREARVALPDWPVGAAPVTAALIGDVHIGDAVTNAERFERIAGAVAARRPDLVVLAGDFIAGHERADAEAAPGLLPGLRRLRAPLGVVAVPGNHDHWTNVAAVRRVLGQAGVTVLANRAVRRGPLALGGVDDLATRHADVARTLAAMRRVGGAAVLVSHSPDVAPALVRGLVLAGHTHCGQVILPLFGAPVDVAHPRYRCGMVREGARTVIVTAGTGTSVLPIRFGAPPDVWLVRVGP